jgi:hypothetical protein
LGAWGRPAHSGHPSSRVVPGDVNPGTEHNAEAVPNGLPIQKLDHHFDKLQYFLKRKNQSRETNWILRYDCIVHYKFI